MIFLNVLFILSSASVCVGLISDYCNLDSCRGKAHIACLYNGTWAPTCPENATLVTLSSVLKTYIVTTHNGLRNKIALGKLKGFKPAVRMATMKWDEELATLASYNVMQCAMKHDKCRNTKRFKYAGQNLAYRATTGSFGDVKEFINRSISVLWHGEHVDTKPSDIDKCCRNLNPTDKMIGHFLQIVSDSSTHVGCAYAQYTMYNIFHTSLFACNYSRNSITGRPIYKTGKKVSGCKKGRNPKYYGLCSTNEKIDPNSID